jgi:hypothetical protein
MVLAVALMRGVAASVARVTALEALLMAAIAEVMEVGAENSKAMAVVRAVTVAVVMALAAVGY